QAGTVGKLERRGFGSLFRHGNLPFPRKGLPFRAALCPHVGRGLEGCDDQVRGGLNPLRGPSAALTAQGRIVADGDGERQENPAILSSNEGSHCRLAGSALGGLKRSFVTGLAISGISALAYDERDG